MLLDQIGADTLVLTGVASHQCVLFTAADAYVRNYRLIIPRDCVAAADAKDTVHSVRYYKTVLKAAVRTGSRIALPAVGSTRTKRT